MKSRLFKMAWAIKANFASFSEALKTAWAAIKLQIRLLTESVVNFSYKKVDGSIRQAKGSNADLPYTGTPKRETNFGVLVYWDLEVNAFRSAKIELLIF